MPWLVPAKGLLDSFGIFGCDLEQRSSRSVWLAPSLLPISKSRYAYTDHHRIFVLLLS